MREFKFSSRQSQQDSSRRGIVIVLTGFALVVVFAFVALSVDTGRMVLTETEMQNACDAAVLAAAQEINAAVYAAGQGQGSANIDANSVAVAAARLMAQNVAEANGIYVDPATDVKFGRRRYNASSGTWVTEWGLTPYNVVQVTARKTNSDVNAPDGELPLAFGWAVGRSQVPLQTKATAFIEARDLAVVIDYSGSMNYDSNLVQSDLPLNEVEQLLDNMWNEMVAADPHWPDTGTSKFPATGFGQINSYRGTKITSSDTNTIRQQLGLNNNVGGEREFPYPQAGRYSDGTPKPKPSNSNSDAMWNRYIDFVKNHPNSSYRKYYGYRTLMDFLQQKSTNGYTPRERKNSEDMWRTPHQPMQAVKNGTSLFLSFLEELDFGDEVGLVGYGTDAWIMSLTPFDDGSGSIDLSADPISPDYQSLDLLHRHHQAGERGGQTGMGDGILKGRELLVGKANDPTDDGYCRYGARPTMLLMTDGQANQIPSGWKLPNSFNWSDWADFDGDGTSDFSTSDKNKQYAFYQAVEAAKLGITIHTLAVGAEADTELMQAIASVGKGICIVVPAGPSAVMEAQLIEAYRNIASQVPQSALVNDVETGEGN